MMYAADEEGSAILTVLPTDAIPAILHPTFVPAQHAQVAPDVAMIGVVFNGEAHAYAAVLLNAPEMEFRFGLPGDQHRVQNNLPGCALLPTCSTCQQAAAGHRRLQALLRMALPAEDDLMRGLARRT